jgi:hypothetical protein
MISPTLTILAMPKPFHGHIGVIQSNAIASWTKLVPRPEILLFGEEQGVAETAAELGIGHLRDVARNEFGTPLFDDLLRRARAAMHAPLVCFVNSDIILLQEFLEAAASVAGRFPQFLAVAHRLNIDAQAPIAFEGDWRAPFRTLLARGVPGDHTAIDVFLFPPNLYSEVPPLVIGRAWIDQWLIKAARLQGVPVVDVTRVARAIHQNHEYGHIAGGQRGAYWGKEALRNLALYGGIPHAYTLLDVTHELLPGGRLRRVRLRRQSFAVRQWLWRHCIERTAPLRRRLGLRRAALRSVRGKEPAAKA